MNEPVYERPIEEGAYPPVAGLSELRRLLNHAWRRFEYDGEGDVTVLVQAELMFGQAVLDGELRAGRMVGRYFERMVVPAEHLDTIANKAWHDGHSVGKVDGDVELREKLAAIEAVLPPDAPDDPVRKILGDDTTAAEYIARIERAAYERGKNNAETHSDEEWANAYAALDSKDKQLVAIRTKIERAAEAESKLEMIAQIAARLWDFGPKTANAAIAAEIREVLDS